MTEYYKDEKRELLNALESLNKDQLKAYAREKGIRLFTGVPQKMREAIAEIEISRKHKGDSFRQLEEEDG